jgi:metal transporter CNNM
MVEGALQMKTKCAMDVYTPMRNMYAVPITTELNEETIVDIYSSGFSRIPVFEVNPAKPKQKSAVRGVLMTKQLIVVNASDCRPLNTLPLYQPMCVSPKLNLVDRLNMFQTGKSGHLALVCARPDIAESCLISEEALPDRAGFMGIVTLEDVLEELLQEEIADEYDKKEWKEEKLSLWVIHKWKRFVKRRKKERESEDQLPAVVGDVTGRTDGPTESTGLLGDQKSRDRKGSKILGLF